MDPKTKRRAIWSVTLGTVIGIPIRIHVTFLILLIWFGYHASRVGHRMGLAVVFLFLLFGCVLLHELGHAAMGRSFGVRTREIVLYPFGGVARLGEIPGGKAELLIAFAGPLVNLTLASLVEVTMLIVGIPPGLPRQLLEPHHLLQYLLAINLMLFLFNLIPAFPMDGGRVLRAALTLTTSATRATEIAAAIGRVIAIGLAVVGVFSSNPFLIVIALFVFIGASQEALFFRQQAALEGRVAGDVMVTHFETLRPQEPIREVFERWSRTHQRDFPVVDVWDRVVGVLSRRRLLEALAGDGGEGLVLDVMDREFHVAGPQDGLPTILRLLRSRPGSPVLVMTDRRLLGLITVERLSEVVELSRRGAGGAGRV